MENGITPYEPTEPDPAAAAFARLESEVGVVRRLVAANDNSATLGEIVLRLDRMVDAIKVLARRPAMSLTPDTMAEQIAKVGETARAEDAAAIRQARERIEKASRELEGLIGKAATIREQRRRLAWMGGGGLLAGMLLWSFLPGTIARAAPASWYWPERMAAHVVDTNLWAAGERLLATGDPKRWQALLLDSQIIGDNRETLTACRDTAAKAEKQFRCAIKIRPRKS